jgi:transcriptional regulator with XRE-family HTH domain
MLSVESFSDWLLKELNARNMSQSDLARVAGLGSGTISNIVSGNRKVGQETLDKIARALRLPPEAVFRAAGLLPPNKDLDPWVEQQKEIISKLTGTRRNNRL